MDTKGFVYRLRTEVDFFAERGGGRLKRSGGVGDFYSRNRGNRAEGAGLTHRDGFWSQRARRREGGHRRLTHGWFLQRETKRTKRVESGDFTGGNREVGQERWLKLGDTAVGTGVVKRRPYACGGTGFGIG